MDVTEGSKTMAIKPLDTLVEHFATNPIGATLNAETKVMTFWSKSCIALLGSFFAQKKNITCILIPHFSVLSHPPLPLTDI